MRPATVTDEDEIVQVCESKGVQFAFKPPCWTISVVSEPPGGGGTDHLLMQAEGYGRVFPLYTDLDLAERAIASADVRGGVAYRIGDRVQLLAVLRAAAADGVGRVTFDAEVNGDGPKRRTRFADLNHVIDAVADRESSARD